MLAAAIRVQTVTKRQVGTVVAAEQRPALIHKELRRDFFWGDGLGHLLRCKLLQVNFTRQLLKAIGGAADGRTANVFNTQR